jgi:GTP-binding protein
MDKPRIVCFTKIDAISEELKKKLKNARTAGIDKIQISSITGENLQELKDLLWKKLKTLDK